MNTNWITVAIVIAGLTIAVGGALRDAYRDFRNKRNGLVTWGQIAESDRICREADQIFSLTPCFRVVQAPPYDWSKE